MPVMWKSKGGPVCVLQASKRALCVKEGRICVSLLSSHQKYLYYSPDTRCKMQNKSDISVNNGICDFDFIIERAAVNKWVPSIACFPLCIVC